MLVSMVDIGRQLGVGHSCIRFWTPKGSPREKDGIDPIAFRKWLDEHQQKPRQKRPANNSNDPRPGIIYLLRDPRTNKIRYVGKTGRTPADRLKGHRHDAKQDRR